MKSLLCGLTSIVAITLLTPAAKAADWYVFGDYNYIDTSDYSLNGFDTGLGLGFGKHFGVEAGYIYASGSGVSVNGGLLDLSYHFPLGESRFSLFATAGGEYIDARDAGWGFRGGGGVEYWLGKGVALRVGARYQSALDDGLIANAGFIIRL